MAVGTQLRIDARHNRERILAAATAVFAEKGRTTEIKDIADRAGVAIGTLYRHFAGKDDLLEAIVHAAFAAMVADARAAEAYPDPIVALRALLRQTCRNAEQYGWLVEVLLSDQLPAEVQERLRAELVEQRFLTRFERAVRRAIAAGQLRADLDPPTAALLLEGAATPWVYRRYRGDRTADQVADALLTTLLRGATPPDPA
jgi:AcrR family transcriptional regulator